MFVFLSPTSDRPSWFCFRFRSILFQASNCRSAWLAKVAPSRFEFVSQRGGRREGKSEDVVSGVKLAVCLIGNGALLPGSISYLGKEGRKSEDNNVRARRFRDKQSPSAELQELPKEEKERLQVRHC